MQKTTRKEFQTTQGVKWSDHADKSLVKDSETGRTRHETPKDGGEEKTDKVNSNWPY